jgi:hypothetical protein
MFFQRGAAQRAMPFGTLRHSFGMAGTDHGGRQGKARMSDDQGETRLRRRSVVVRVAAVGTAAVGLGGCVVVPAAPVRPAQVRTGMSDADPSDGPGRGR